MLAHSFVATTLVAALRARSRAGRLSKGKRKQRLCTGYILTLTKVVNRLFFSKNGGKKSLHHFPR